MTAKEVAEMLGVTGETIKGYVRRENYPLRKERRNFFLEKDVLEFIENQKKFSDYLVEKEKNRVEEAKKKKAEKIAENRAKFEQVCAEQRRKREEYEASDEYKKKMERKIADKKRHADREKRLKEIKKQERREAKRPHKENMLIDIVMRANTCEEERMKEEYIKKHGVKAV